MDCGKYIYLSSWIFCRALIVYQDFPKSKDFEEAQDEESGKAESAEKRKALSGVKKRMEDLDRIIQHIYEGNVLDKPSDSRYWQYEKEQTEILPPYWNGNLKHRPGRFWM